MAIAFDSDATTTDVNGGSVVANQPSGVAATKLAIAQVVVFDTSNLGSSSPATGWSTYREDAYTPSNQWVMAIYYKILVGGDSFTFTTSANYTEIYISLYTGHNTTTPLVDTGTANSGTGVTATGLEVTVTTADSFLFFAHTGYTSGLTSGPVGMNAREVNFDGVVNWYDLSVAAGGSGNKTAVVPNDEWSVTMGVIAPDGAEPAPEVTPDANVSTLSFPSLGASFQRRAKSGIYVPDRRIHAPFPLRPKSAHDGRRDRLLRAGGNRSQGVAL